MCASLSRNYFLYFQIVEKMIGEIELFNCENNSTITAIDVRECDIIYIYIG